MITVKTMKTTLIAIALALTAALSLTACNREEKASGGTFLNVDDAWIPDILEKTVGTVGDVYFTSFGKSDDKDYQSYLKVTFENTTEADYAELMEHYQSASSGTDEDGFLLYDWGRLLVTVEEDSVQVDAYMK